MKNLKNMISKTPSESVLEGFQNNKNALENVEKNVTEDLKEEHDKLKKYMEIHGLYPQNHGVDMSKYVLKDSQI